MLSKYTLARSIEYLAALDDHEIASIISIMFALTTFACLLSLSLTNALSINSRQTTACNNSPDLCSRSYSSITHLGAHDSPFVRDATTGNSVSGNQYYNTTVQLDAGVRLVTAQVHKNNNNWHLCHSSCDLLDAGLLSTWLSEIKGWMEANPNEVVTVLLVNSDNAAISDLDAQFQTANITSLAYKPASTTTPPTTWPTLQELINAGTRLMVFATGTNTANVATEQSYLMNEFTYIFENNYDNTNVSDFNCLPNRPGGLTTQSALSSNRMPFMNHFLYSTGALNIETPDTANLNTTNSPGTTTPGQLGYALNTCKSQYSGRAPVFTLVDFFDVGPAIEAVDTINGITPTGRIPVPARDTSASRDTTSFEGVTQLVQEVNDGKHPSKGAWIWAAGQWTLGGINLSGGDVLS